MSSAVMDEVARNLVAVTGDPATAPRQAFTGDYRYALRVTGGEKWNQGLSSSGLGSAIHHTLARRNARVAMQDSVQARACVTRSADSISDGGLRLELAPVIGILGITKEKAAEWSRDVEERFDLWAKSMQAHRAGFMNFYRAQGFWAFCRQRDNDQFVRLYYDDDPTLQNPLQFEFLDPDQIRGDAFTNLYGFNQTTTTNGFQLLADGIQRDERGRETGYKVWIRNGDGTYLGPYMETNLSYQFGPASTLSWNARYGTEPSGLTNVTQRQTFRTGLSLGHAFTPRISANLGINFEEDYFQQSGVINSFNETIISLSAGVNYTINRHLSLSLGYQFTDVLAPKNVSYEYTRSVAFVGANLNF